MKKSRLESSNFLISLVSMILVGFGVSSIEISLDPGQLVFEIMNKNFEWIAQIAMPAIVAAILKIAQKIKDGTFKVKNLFKSLNFITALVGAVSALLALVGFILPEDAPLAIAQAVYSGSVISMVAAFIMYFFNPLWHIIQDWIKNNRAKTAKAVTK